VVGPCDYESHWVLLATPFVCTRCLFRTDERKSYESMERNLDIEQNVESSTGGLGET